MRSSLRRVVVNLTVFVVVCAVSAFGLLAIFANLRFSSEELYRAEFTDVSGLEVDDFVRIAGVEVGQVKKISINPDAHAIVEFSADPSVDLTGTSKAQIRWENPIGDRYMALLEGAGKAERLAPGMTIPVDRTEPALDLDTLLGGFRPLFRALDPDQVNTLSTALIQAFQGEGATIGSFLNQAAALTNTLADRDILIGEVIGNLNTVLGSFGGQTEQFAKSVDSLTLLVKGLEERKGDVANAVAYTNAASATVADLLMQAREPMKEAVVQSDRATSLVLADHEYFDGLLNMLPDAYKKLSRLGSRGDFIPEYLCAMSLKLNGKGGQPVYVKLAEQTTGRCAPK
ncbi:MCE family protein [Mycolicibacterium parafortuitum]|uniref:Mce-family protein Mce3B [Mycobacterium tuberculosis H37Rv] n=1 Tax=Mycolicibacterium parafortuitum TaxID=39692 RepID=A0A375YB48_MYCPF|nr:MCE family protein [Mycolicibacterium parafortuitum]ORB31749.1 virulence factor Mce [Mycolicibacterium parafortuitum]SRX78311.1 Mce-family protein Mce3B [Mycobacterium tuberculosis H37Rv] [Mycolicibacterium parafortuitum]